MTDTTTRFERRIVQPTGLEPAWIDPDAYRAVAQLQERGHEAYLVGGCVRDMLLGRRPKDFDIATSARPQHVKRIFPRNCRIIGRRFKLAHLHFHRNRKILEVSTFRRTPEEQNGTEDLLITQDNEFGSAEEDALRRDFTMNALLYDPVADTVLDYVGGLEHVHERKLETIGDPEVRFREDPVRILRAVKFAGRLDFEIEKDTWRAMKRTAPDLSRSAPPRLLEEILRLLRAGHAFRSFRLLHEVGALSVLLPLVADFLGRTSRERRREFWSMLDLLDARVHQQGSAPPNGVLLGTLFALPALDAVRADPDKAPKRIIDELLTPFGQQLRLPRRDIGCLKEICSVQHRMLGESKRVRPAKFAQREYFSEAVMLHELLTAAIGHDGSASGLGLEVWRGLADYEGPDDGPALTFVEPIRDPSWPLPARARRDTGAAHERTAADDRGPGSRDEARPSKKRKSDRDESGRKRGKKNRADKGPSKRGGKKGSGSSPRDDAAGKDKKKKRKRGGKNRERKADKVEELEPEAIDTSIFDVELSAKRPPTFGSLVEGTTKKKRRMPTAPEEDTYKPPLPPGPDAESPPPPPPPETDDGGEFGDW